MNNENWIRHQIRKVLSEQRAGEEENDPEEKSEEKKDLPKTSGPGRGRFKKELKDMKALADDNPQQLMQNLGISGVGGADPQGALNNLLQKAISNSTMAQVYQKPKPKEDEYGRAGVEIPVTGEISPRDALIFIRETVKGAKNAGMYQPDGPVQVELLGNSILAYLSANTFEWNKKKRD